MTEFTVAHWTDYVTDRPIFHSVIDAHGPGGNIFVVLGRARSLMRALRLPADRIAAFDAEVRATHSYDDAVAVVERWFRVDRD